MTIHLAAATGFAAAADAYDRGRPDYPAGIADWLQRDLALAPGKTVVDLGAGTGKFTPYLTATGATVIAVEPVDNMRKKLSASQPAIRALSGTAEAIPLPDASVDAVVCAQAFHWFATSAALAEIRRVLKPGGALGLVWNTRDESQPWVARLSAIISEKEGDTPRYGSHAWQRPFPAKGLSAMVERDFPHLHTGSPEQVIVDRTMSISFVAALPADERQAVEARIRGLIAGDPSIAGQATVSYPT